MVAAVLGNPGGVTLVVVGPVLSTVTGFALVSVYADVVVMGTVVPAVSTGVNETGIG